ncbi:MAG: exosortase system-associated protein, TIGR04073 family [Candidatus Omnitrophica bacterium]|nr:exosortase system-associated protein, TIGR04073 family [Candidatus Omnitrophota bacterium]
MRKSKSIIFTLVFLMSMNMTAFAAYAQAQVQTPKGADPITMSEINTYRINPASAQSSNIKQPATLNAKSEPYADTPVEKMGVGIINTTTSWADIPQKVAEVSERDNIFLGVTLGLGEGIVSGVARGASGVADVATFGLAPYNQPSAKPVYKVENPNEGFKIDLMKW